MTATKRCITTSASQYKLAFTVSMGGMLEVYDFLIYGLMATYIAENFFPSQEPPMALLNTFATFAVGYLTRPLGGLFFGHFGDRNGRKQTFILSIFMMAVSTALIGCLPNRETIGLAAPIFLVILRLLQGFSLGGEIPGAITYMSESAPERRGLIIGILFTAIMSGIALGTFVLGIIETYLDDTAMSSWGWRVPFWVGGSLGVISYHIRKHFTESGLFEALILTRCQASIPIIQLFKKHSRGVLCGLAITALCGSAATVYGIYLPSYLSSTLHFSKEAVAWHTTLAFLMVAPVCMLCGLLTDSVNHKLILGLFAIAIALGCWPAFQYFASASAKLKNIMLLCAIFTALPGGLLPLLVNFFPTEVRYTGIATCYNLGFAVFGGFAPFFTTALAGHVDDHLGPAIYLFTVALASLIALLFTWPNEQLSSNISNLNP